jgi:hypothetical protein
MIACEREREREERNVEGRTHLLIIPSPKSEDRFQISNNIVSQTAKDH